MVIVGNVFGINDGVVVVVLVIVDVVKKVGLKLWVCFFGYYVVGVCLDIMGIGLVLVVEGVLKWIGLMIVDFDVIELNEVFVV